MIIKEDKNNKYVEPETMEECLELMQEVASVDIKDMEDAKVIIEILRECINQAYRFVDISVSNKIEDEEDIYIPAS